MKRALLLICLLLSLGGFEHFAQAAAQKKLDPFTAGYFEYLGGKMSTDLFLAHCDAVIADKTASESQKSMAYQERSKIYAGRGDRKKALADAEKGKQPDKINYASTITEVKYLVDDKKYPQAVALLEGLLKMDKSKVRGPIVKTIANALSGSKFSDQEKKAMAACMIKRGDPYVSSKYFLDIYTAFDDAKYVLYVNKPILMAFEITSIDKKPDGGLEFACWRGARGVILPVRQADLAIASKCKQGDVIVIMGTAPAAKWKDYAVTMSDAVILE